MPIFLENIVIDKLSKKIPFDQFCDSLKAFEDEPAAHCRR
jgi:hypothetical protein